MQVLRMSDCHFSNDKTGKLQCYDCPEYKQRKLGYGAKRDAKYETPAPLILFSTDFFGPVEPKSYRKNTWCMLFVCDKCSLERKSDAPEALEEFVSTAGLRIGDAKFKFKQNASS